MNRKIIRPTAFFLLILIVLLSAGCTSGTKNPEATPDPTPKSGIVSRPIMEYDEIRTVTWVRVAPEPLSRETLEFILLNFGLKIDEQYFSSANMTQNIMNRYTSGICPDFATGISIETAKALGEAGYLENLSTRRDELSAYFALWDDWQEGWSYTKNMISVSDNLYCLVPVNRKASLGWIYNKTAFEADSVKMPDTLSKLYEILMRYKEKHESKYPLWMNEYEALEFKAILNSFGLTDEEWQTDENGRVFWLYSDKRWYEALEWLVKFEKAGLVPTNQEKELRTLSEKEYISDTADGAQIVEFTHTYKYFYLMAEQKDTRWDVMDYMIRATEDSTPVIQSGCPYLNEAFCVSQTTDAKTKKLIFQFINWLCTDEGNIWANFGNEGEGYVMKNSKPEFLRYYSEEVTPELDPLECGKISDITVGRMFTTDPVDTFTGSKTNNRYAVEEDFLERTGVKIKVPEVFASAESVLEDKTLLWDYERQREKIASLAEEFEEYTRVNGFSDYFWDRYCNELAEAGLEEYTKFMQKRLR